MTVSGHTAGTPPAHGCSGDFNVYRDYHDVDYDETARAVGSGTCSSPEGPVAVTIRGVVGTDRTFSGTISGSVGTRQDTTALTGTLNLDDMRLSFADLEPVTGISYSGTIVSR